MRIFKDKEKCEKPTCTDLLREYIDIEGICKKCPDYLAPTIDLKACEKPKCGSEIFYKIKKDGVCEKCPDF